MLVSLAGSKVFPGVSLNSSLSRIVTEQQQLLLAPFEKPSEARLAEERLGSTDILPAKSRSWWVLSRTSAHLPELGVAGFVCATIPTYF